MAKQMLTYIIILNVVYCNARLRQILTRHKIKCTTLANRFLWLVIRTPVNQMILNILHWLDYEYILYEPMSVYKTEYT